MIIDNGERSSAHLAGKTEEVRLEELYGGEPAPDIDMEFQRSFEQSKSLNKRNRDEGYTLKPGPSLIERIRRLENKRSLAQLEIKKVAEKHGLPSQLSFLQRISGDNFLLGNGNLFVFDEDGKKVRELRGRAVEYPFKEKLRELYGDKVVFIENNSPLMLETSDYQRKLSDLPVKFQKIIRKVIDFPSDPESYYQFVIGEYPVLKFDLSKSVPYQTVCNGKYLVSADTAGKFTAVQQRGENGKQLNPSELVTYTVFDDTLPEDLQKWVEQQDSEKNYFQATEDLDYSVSNEKGIEFYRKGDYSTPIFTEPSIADKEGQYAVSKGNPPVLYYMSAKDPLEMSQIVLSGDPTTWKVRTARFPNGRRYGAVSHLQVDLTGQFLIFESQTQKGIEILDANSLHTRGQISGVRMPTLDARGELSAVKKNRWNSGSSLVRYQVNFEKLRDQLRQEQTMRVAKGEDPENSFFTKAERDAQEQDKLEVQARPLIDQILSQMPSLMDSDRLDDEEGGNAKLDSILEELKQNLEYQGLDATTVHLVLKVIRKRVIEPTKQKIKNQL